MFIPAYTKQFERDAGLARRRDKNMEKLKIIIEAVLTGLPIDPIHKDHKLSGDYLGRRECHIEFDWLLIYKISQKTIIFERTGTHSDLFD